MVVQVSRGFNVMALVLVAGAILAAFFMQWQKHEIPCPLCLLQRAALLGIAIGLAMNLRFGAKPGHYAMIALATTVGLVIAGRQTLLHITPGSGAYGEALWGLHLYVWAFLLFAALGVGTVLMSIWEWARASTPARTVRAHSLTMALMATVCLLALGNGIATVLECAIGMCPADPISYLLLD